jgi:transposase
MPLPVRALGVDEWAYRKGRNYGTILVGLERSRVVGLLPNRSSDSFAEWLKEHPGVEIITRDRSNLYADGASRSAPKAVQVADRWHLIRNLTDAVERALQGRATLLRQATTLVSAVPAVEPAPSEPAPKPSTSAVLAKAARRDRRLACYEEVVALRRRGLSKRAIADQVGLDIRTVR